MNIYSDYINTLNKALAVKKRQTITTDNSWNQANGLEEGFTYEDLKSQIPDNRLLPSLAEFSREMNIKLNFDQQLGLHPDFAYLKGTSSTENHYIVSMFVDIKGSTNLFKKYPPEATLVITNAIQRIAIHTCLVFGGYIHRLQGDGLFVYFGGRTISILEACLRALQSASLLSYFVENDLNQAFTNQGIENIVTHIGIDLGYKDDVLWAMAGIGEISEVTTCSLHTSLASKMQGYASSNGIVVGDNIKTQDKIIEGYCTPVVQRTQKDSDRYIFQIPEESFRYTQYDFDWLRFLKAQSYIATDIRGELTLKRKTSPSEHSVEDLRPIIATNKPYSK